MKTAPHFGVIDIGNSGIKAALAETATQHLVGPVRSLHWSFPSDTSKLPPKEFLESGSTRSSIDDLDAIAHLIGELKRSRGGRETPMHWRVSCVQPHALANLARCLAQHFTEDTYRNLTYSDIPLVYRVDAPESVGVDRLLAAWGAWQSNGKQGPLIVIQAGTAVTVDWVNEQGAYCGGAIMPGLSLTLKYLALGTAHLPWLAPPRDPRDVALPGRNTQEAILAGVTSSFIGGIEHLQRRYREQYGGNPNDIATIVSGGDGLTLARSITSPFQIVDHLVLNAMAQLDAVLP